MGVFYEGGSSEMVEIDNSTAHLYLYESTVSVEEVGEPLEGRLAHRLVHAGHDWWGMGVHWSSPRDLSGWASLHVSFRSESLAEIEIGLNGASDDRLVRARHRLRVRRRRGVAHPCRSPLATSPPRAWTWGP